MCAWAFSYRHRLRRSGRGDTLRRYRQAGGRVMAMLRFSIVGAADPARNDPQRPDQYKPFVNIDETKAIARALGSELAKRGHGLSVYDANFIEADTVAGYVAAKPKAPAGERPTIVTP